MICLEMTTITYENTHTHTHTKDTRMHVMYANKHCADQNMFQIQYLDIFMFIM